MCLKRQSIKGAPPLEILLIAVVSQGTFNRHCQFMDEVESSVLRATRFLEKFAWDSAALFSAQPANVSNLRCQRYLNFATRALATFSGTNFDTSPFKDEISRTRDDEI